jgi:hypothetical protein
MAKKINLKLVGLNGNAFAILGAFNSAAKKQGWTREEIAEVTKEAMSKDYDHLLATIADHCKNPAGPTDEDIENEMGI